MMSLKPWREVAQPRKDVLEGSFKQSEFAADITQVHSGTAPEEYQDPEKFFARTYITEGMRLLLISVAQRLAGSGGDPVIQLQTAFGGGKTHTLLAVYHLASRAVSTDQLRGVPPVLDEADIHDLPQSRIAVLDGIKLSPSHPRKHGKVTVNTLWGELAWQLLGEQGLEMVSGSDVDGTSPGKEVLTQLVGRAAPCVILVDELVAFMRQLEHGKQYKAGTFDSNISFVQGLTEAMKGVPNAILLASLPESDVEVGGAMGQQALASLEKFFGRVESVWKPVDSEEAFEIVRRRLFDEAGDRATVEGISRQFCDFYRDNAEKFPAETQSDEYFERLCNSYPIHPEVFDRLYEDWSTLDKFQRTRGVLQYMAVVINRLWNGDNRDALIMPGSLPLADADVRHMSIRYLPHNWEPVIEKEVDGPRSVPQDLDGHDTRFGSIQAARRAMRTIFLGSAPSAPEQTVRGIETERVILGAAQPGQTIGVYEDVLKRLRDRLHYLYTERDRFWLDTRPNLRREMESRKQRINDRDELLPLIKNRMTRVFGRNHRFGGIHVFTPSVDVPDDYGTGPRLVVLPMTAAYSRAEANQAFGEAEQILRNRGDQPRQKQNRLIFLAPDFDVVGRLKEQARGLLAWQSIIDDIEGGSLNHDLTHLSQAKRQREGADQSLSQLVREAWKWLMAPIEEFEKGKPVLKWEVVQVSPTAQNLVQEIEEKLREEEWLIYEWSPIHLRNILQQYYFEDSVKDVSALKIWQDTCHYLYLPRLVNDEVYRNAIVQGVESQDYFGFAAGKEDSRYLGFSFGKNAIPSLDESSLLIDREAAVEYAATLEQEAQPGSGPDTPSPPEGPEPSGEDEAAPGGAASGESVSATKKHFYGTVSMDPVRAKMDFATLIDEVVQHFTERTDVGVTISVEIEAKSGDGFDENLQRTVRENCNTLGFNNAEFEEG